MLLVPVHALLSLAEPGLAVSAPPGRSGIPELEATGRTRLPRHRDGWRRRQRLLRRPARAIHELLIELVLLQLPSVCVLPARRVWGTVRTLVAEIPAAELVGLFETQPLA